MKTITKEEREKLNEILLDEIITDLVQHGDITVLSEIVENLSDTTAYYSLSDEGQKKIKLNK